MVQRDRRAGAHAGRERGDGHVGEDTAEPRPGRWRWRAAVAAPPGAAAPGAVAALRRLAVALLAVSRLAVGRVAGSAVALLPVRPLAVALLAIAWLPVSRLAVSGLAVSGLTVVRLPGRLGCRRFAASRIAGLVGGTERDRVVGRVLGVIASAAAGRL